MHDAISTAELRDSARRQWRLELRRDPARGRTIVFSPVHGDLEPFRASVDGRQPSTHVPLGEEEWALFVAFAARPDDTSAQHAAFQVFDRLVRQAQHASLMGAGEDDDE